MLEEVLASHVDQAGREGRAGEGWRRNRVLLAAVAGVGVRSVLGAVKASGNTPHTERSDD